MRGVGEVAAHVRIIPGEEITTDQGDLIGLFLQEEVRPGPLEQVLDALRAQDAVVYVPHPFDAMRRKECVRSIAIKDVADAIEGFNARCVLPRYNRRAMDYARRHGLPIGAGSDAHSSWEVGHGYTVMEDFHDSKSFLDALRTGRIVGRPSIPLFHAQTKVLKLIRPQGAPKEAGVRFSMPGPGKH